MKIGLLFGSFNPIHTGHLIIANDIANFYVDEVWFIVSPHNPFKQAADLLPAANRLELVKLSIENDSRLQVSDIEFTLPTPSYTINTLKKLTANHPSAVFYIIIGSDNLAGIQTWKSSGEILANYKLLVYERPGFGISHDLLKENIQLVRSPLLDISSTEIRKYIKANKSIRYLVPGNVAAAIQRFGYYK